MWYFRELDVSESITALEVLQLPGIKELFEPSIEEFKIGVNSIELDGKYKALPQNYRMSDGERIRGLQAFKPRSKRKKKN